MADRGSPSDDSSESGFETLSDNELFMSKLSYKKMQPPAEKTRHIVNGVEVKLPPCRPLVASGHSLESDMLFG